MIWWTTLGMKCLYAPAPRKEIWESISAFFLLIPFICLKTSGSDIAWGIFDRGFFKRRLSGIDEKSPSTDLTPILSSISFCSLSVSGIYLIEFGSLRVWEFRVREIKI